MKKNNKASLEALNELHAAVANQLRGNLDDPKILSAAIKFLKDNDITADLIEDSSMSSLGQTIKEKLSTLEERPLSMNELMDLHVS